MGDINCLDINGLIDEETVITLAPAVIIPVIVVERSKVEAGFTILPRNPYLISKPPPGLGFELLLCVAI